MCGDPLNDIGQLFDELHGDSKLLKATLEGYGPQIADTSIKKQCILFYAVCQRLWLYSGASPLSIGDSYKRLQHLLVVDMSNL